MTKHEIMQRLEKIKEVMDKHGDYEKAHGLEDGLFADFIESLTSRSDHVGEKARLVLTSHKLNFARHCA